MTGTELTREELALVESLRDTRFVIADPSTSRRSLRRLLSHYQMRPHQVDVVETAEDAKELIRDKRPSIVFADSTLGGASGFELIELHQNTPVDTPFKAFFLITSQDSNLVVSSAAAESVDAVLIKPFTFDLLKQNFIRVLGEKIKPSPYIQRIQEGKDFLKNGELENALDSFVEARGLDPKPALALYLEGQTHQKMGRPEDAQKAFENGLQFNPTHFGCLSSLTTLLMKKGEINQAYSMGRTLVEHHTVPIQLIPDLIRLSVKAGKYEDVVGFYEVVSTLDDIDPSMAMNLGAALVVAGLSFLQRGDATSAVSTFKKAEVISKRHPAILKRILQALVEADIESELKSFVARLPEELRDSVDMKLAELESLNRKDPLRALELSLRMIKDRVKHERIYEVAIMKSVELKRKPSLIEELVSRAVHAFPDKRENFEKMAKTSSSPSS